MTKLLEKAIAKVRELPAEDQDTVAVMVLSAHGGDANYTSRRGYARRDPARTRTGPARQIRAGRGNRSSLEAPRSMKLCYTPRALSDLQSIFQFIDERSPRGARNVKRAIQKTIELIGE